MSLIDMTVNSYTATGCNPEVNAKILRAVQKIVNEFDDTITGTGSDWHEWSCCVEFWDDGADEPYYRLAAQRPKATCLNGAETQLETLKMFPPLPMTGLLATESVIKTLKEQGHDSVILQFPGAITGCYWDLPSDLRNQLERFYSITNTPGGIRVPYKVLVTCSKDVLTEYGEIRVAFCGATEWQNMFYTFKVFGQIQKILKKLWKEDAISYDLSKLCEYGDAKFWMKLLKIRET